VAAPHPEARSATSGETDAIAVALAAAFEDDPVWRWLIRSDRRWRHGAPRVFRHPAAEYLRAESAWVSGDNSEPVGAAALWGPPGHEPSRLREVLALPKIVSAFGVRTAGGFRMEGAMRRARPREPHWYLALLGTHPAHQGKGLGSAVLQPVLDRCDEEGLGAYLESSKASNIPFYGRHGFELTGELDAPGGAPPLHLMWRNPR
jgi:GNAT superfamily N-acetyltransferase